MIRVHTSSFAPKYESGKWSWDNENDSLQFHHYFTLESLNTRYKKTNGFRFLKTITQEEELIFRQEFVRSETSFDADVITIADIRNLVLFLMPSEMLSRKFIEFMHTQEVKNLLHALIIYFQYYLRYAEFVLIRRDEIVGEAARIQSVESVKLKRIFANRMSRYRLLVAREYSVIMLGEGGTAKFYHMKPIANISDTIQDKIFYEHFFAVCIQIVWISMHRRGYDNINAEMSRLFRSDHFKSYRTEPIFLSPADSSVLNGRNCKIVNYRAQNSPLIQELLNVSKVDLPILWIGKRKYRGTDKCILALELEYIVPDSQLTGIEILHGILGHPKRLYNTLLELDWEAVRFQNYTEKDDPYRLIQQPHIPLPNIDEEKLRAHEQNYKHYYELIHDFEKASDEMLEKWCNRDRVIKYYYNEGFITNIWMRCKKDIADSSYGPSVNEITSRFHYEKEKLRKVRAADTNKA